MRSLLTLLVLFVSVYCNGQKLKITIYNKTGYDVDLLYIEHNYVGSIKKDSSKIVLDCYLLELQNEVPPEFPVVGELKNKDRGSMACGLNDGGFKKYHVVLGEYKFDLMCYENKAGYLLYWLKH